MIDGEGDLDPAVAIAVAFHLERVEGWGVSRSVVGGPSGDDAAAGFARVGVERGIESNLEASDERVELGLALEIAVGVARRGVGGG